ncbi:MAG: hypothetical protein HY547_03255 [Elusimicrobia bacterium]|nr:hypothetical protein [Elusimicrobiota bacterium]
MSRNWRNDHEKKFQVPSSKFQVGKIYNFSWAFFFNLERGTWNAALFFTMKLLPKWFILFLLTGFYVFFLAGMFYNNLFRWFFDEKLKQEIVALLYVNQNRVISGMMSSPKVVTIEEVDTMQNFRKDPRVIHALVINKYGQIRWSADPAMFNKRLEEYQAVYPAATDALPKAYVTKSPKIIPFVRDKAHFYEVAVPLIAQGEVWGVASLEVSREEAKETLAQGMRKFYAGGVGVIFIFLATGIVFLYRSVISPLSQTAEILETLSVAQPAWPAEKFRSDEIGKVQKALAQYLEKLRAALSRYERDRKDVGDIEKGRWEQILKVLVRSGGVLVLDGDNYVMASHGLQAVFSVKPPPPSSMGRGLPAAIATAATQPAGSVATAASVRTHLLDLATSTELLQLVNKALERPGTYSEGLVVLDSMPHNARILTIAAGQPQDQRTLVWLESQAKPIGPAGKT